MFEVLLTLLVLIPLVGLLAFVYLFADQLAERRAKRNRENFNALRRFNPDLNGNYPAFYDPLNGTYFVPAPGNSPLPVNILMYNGQQKVIAPPPRPITINPPGSWKPADEVPLTAQPAEPSEPSEPLLNPETEVNALPEPLNVRQVQLDLIQAKREGRPKGESIFLITGFKKGGSRDYDSWSTFWNNIEV